ncbi:MAG: co-chaperone GroES [Candidatus Nanohalarchaeota archaeon]|nr:MAG: co-chaperone GroES [Candidatus Nanohaloarchaeota archaeon]
MKIKPLENKILVKTEESEATTKGGIIIPDSAKEKTQIGVVEEIGKTKDNCVIKKGDKILYKKYSGEELKIDDKDYLILEVSNILALVE